MGLWLRWLGILLGAVSIFSLAQSHYEFTAAPGVGDVLHYYRSALQAIIPDALIPISHAADLATPHPEAAAIYLMPALLLLTLYISSDLEWSRSGEESLTWASGAGRVMIALFWPLVLPVAVYLVFIDESENVLKAWGLETGKIFASTVVLFAFNAAVALVL